MIDELFFKIEKVMVNSEESYYGSGPASEEDIINYESELRISFPESYKVFLRKYGTLTFNGESFYGISKKGLSATSAPDVRYVTIEARKLGDIDNNMVQIKSSGYGPVFSIDTSILGDTGEAVVVETPLSFKRDNTKVVVAQNFVDFLLSEIKESLI
ncbi:SMI1/KNR4 family protein [Pectobacterium wasabiae]|uniref:Cell wall assembly/cell proliferation coordinating protein n=1 Tax=Pectobacterium wasabiae TaxID=55208 RepID=A0AAW3EDD7_9GAMM|nr:SMI1/KNR4 family protein [Pectobacterium wasabiae]AOR63388.1 cell wall assembly/cell proliferation coordinating protein [Pectobacterium wasabiae CFBP 3304]EJS96065.1 YobK [Pectobacterium wasabiae CFBP 3304]KFX04113.1 cell wall assembly/cell proliferation coordinating protein [Pectobacterium wasabiae]KGA27247.1 cell wall assembly/cell proliferation coordinating protein [Pectobacterium wasabiae]